MRSSTVRLLLAFCSTTWLGLACSNNGGDGGGGTSGIPPLASATASGSVAANPAAQAKEIFALRCTPCHGPEGRGDGAASASLTPKPRNFHDPEWQKQSSDEHLAKIIQYGGAAVGKSAAMPANPDLGDKPEVVAALRDHIRAMGR